MTATCVDGKQFTVNGVKYDFKSFTCNQWPAHLEKSSGSCLSGKSLIKIGFELSTGFSDIIDVCHDTALHHTIYTKFVLKPDAAGFQSGVDRPDWAKGNYFK